MDGSMTNQEAYQAVVELCQRKHWMATYWTMSEDGYDPKIDYIALLTKWMVT
jgi:hypothetical protein